MMGMMPADIPDKLYFKIGEVAKIAGVEPYVLRYWETEFKEIHPVKSKTNQRLYRRKDLETILKIKALLYEEGFTIEGARKQLKEIQIPLPLGDGDAGRVLKKIRKELEDLLKILEK